MKITLAQYQYGAPRSRGSVGVFYLECSCMFPPNTRESVRTLASRPMEEGPNQFTGKGTRFHACARGDLCGVASIPGSDRMLRSRYNLLHMREIVNTHSLWSHRSDQKQISLVSFKQPVTQLRLYLYLNYI